MNFLVLLSLFVTASASFKTELFKNPRSFVSTFENADPVAINKVIEIVNSMVDQNLAEQALAVKNHADAVEAEKKAKQVRHLATEDLKWKMGERDLSQEDLEKAIDYQGLKKGQLEDALKALNHAQADLDEATTFLEKETKRIDDEKSVLEQVLDILNSLNSGAGRRLLSFSPESFLATLSAKGLKVNPDSLASVVEAVEGLIAEGERLRNVAHDAVTSATTARDDADAAHKKAIECHDKAISATTKATEKRDKYVAQTNAAQIVFDKAVQDHEDSIDTRDHLESVKDSEIARVTSENKDLAEVKRLLVGLL